MAMVNVVHWQPKGGLMA